MSFFGELRSRLQMRRLGFTHVRVSTAFDDCVCEKCRAYEGKVFPILKAPSLPFHDGCRCVLEYLTAEDV